MMRLQNSAPYLNGWLVYMGASDKNVVLLQRELELAGSTTNEWVSLDTVMAEEFKFDDSNAAGLKAMTFYPAIVSDEQQQQQPHNLTINYCLPTWMWTVPVLLLALYVWLQYKRKMNHWLVVSAVEPIEHTGDDSLISSAVRPVSLLIEDERKMCDFTVSTDSYFYPMPAVPPPKYNDAVEAMLTSFPPSERPEKFDPNLI